MRLPLALLALCLLLLTPAISADTPVVHRFDSGLAIALPGVGGRKAFHTDAIEAHIVRGTWQPPLEGDTLVTGEGKILTWEAVRRAEGAAHIDVGDARAGGYLYASYESPRDEVLLLQAAGHGMVYVNGEPRAGDPYAHGYVLLPVLMRTGRNDFLFQGLRAATLDASLVRPVAPVMIHDADLTLPDLLAGEQADRMGGVVLLNCTADVQTGLAVASYLDGEGNAAAVADVPMIPPLTIRKVPFRIAGQAGSNADTQGLTLELIHTEGKAPPWHRMETTIRLRTPEQTQKRTFISSIDNSVQYYALQPASGIHDGERKALVLSLHGASVEAIGQADAYSPKSWAHIVCPTNRRPYGFDWEDWGRIDALEVLAHAKQTLGTDPDRTYLTGHSMGGHGTWAVGTTHPDQFAAIAPSAGWISFWTYVGDAPPNRTDIDRLLVRAAAPSDTLARARNLGQVGVYVLHGDADDNVPVTEARAMKTVLEGFHRDWDYYEESGAGHWWDRSDEPGADCVDWLPIFDFFAHHRVASIGEVRHVQFTTVSPAIASWNHWVRIEDQAVALEPSSVDLRFDPGVGRISGTTTNVSRLQLDLRSLGFQEGDACTVALDGQSLSAPPSAEIHGGLWVQKAGETWEVAQEPDPSRKNPARYGPFKTVFNHNSILVYGTRGTAEENAWAYAKARFDAELWYYRGNGAFDVVADTEFDAGDEVERNVVLYGNAATNSAWDAVVDVSPVVINAGYAQVGGMRFEGGEYGALLVYPREGSDAALVGLVGGTGINGMRATDRCPYFLAGVGYPDYCIFDSTVLERGNAGVVAAGFFGSGWELTEPEA